MTDKNDEFLYKNLTYKIIGFAMEIHRELQSGFQGAVYEEVMYKELKKQRYLLKTKLK